LKFLNYYKVNIILGKDFATTQCNNMKNPSLEFKGAV
jgi:hypothetical protein